MSPEEFAQKMAQIEKDHFNDVELAHCKMDDLMCEALISLGYGGGVKIFKEAYKWYA